MLTDEEIALLNSMREGLVQLEIDVQSTNPETIHEINRRMDIDKLRNVVERVNAGENIPEKSIDKIFNKFYQADESHMSEGNGVGLAIVKKIVELHKGDVNVESVNGITTFEITLNKN